MRKTTGFSFEWSQRRGLKDRRQQKSTIQSLRKTIQVKIVDDEEYEKQENFFIVLEKPRWMKRGISALLLAEDESNEKLSAEEEEAHRIAEMGKPILGEHTKMEVIIEESYEFKSTVDKLIKKTNLALVIGTHSWREQFMEAITVSAGDGEDEDDAREEKLPSCFDYVMHFLTVFWKVLFAFVPPTEYGNGWACFVTCMAVIGLLTAFINDLASHFGCTVGLKDSVTAVVFVALGTSIPDTFASKVSALQDQYADASIGNVTGSNAVNVFLGIGVAWSVAAIYWAAKGKEFRVDPGTLAFSVTLFTIFAFVAVSVLLYRRRSFIGGELGGSRRGKLLTCAMFVSLWLLYVVFSALEAYCHIKGF
ncbi:sodium/calcium exchanger 3-like isoform X2 [Scyliorhinus canicula]|uniref:sodium/calcium exchanger 3-like isoform X2 n=1 Tax=Scyliorhinus canicula TaxID=7830 RepID=UPI0018F670F2|nr:sodium/calcium exchanger 3-like isoform X2 [Scyliorhinus canicula]